MLQRGHLGLMTQLRARARCPRYGDLRGTGEALQSALGEGRECCLTAPAWQDCQESAPPRQ